MYYITQSSIGDLLDVVITEPATQYQHLEYTGSAWVNVSDMRVPGELDAVSIHSDTAVNISAVGATESDPHVYINTTGMTIHGTLSEYIIQTVMGNLVLLGSGGATISLSTVISLENETRVAGDLLPSLASTYNLGSPTGNLKWVNGYFTGDVSAASLTLNPTSASSPLSSFTFEDGNDPRWVVRNEGGLGSTLKWNGLTWSFTNQLLVSGDITLGTGSHLRFSNGNIGDNGTGNPINGWFNGTLQAAGDITANSYVTINTSGIAYSPVGAGNAFQFTNSSTSPSDYFQFNDDVVIYGTEKLKFGTNPTSDLVYIWQYATNKLELYATNGINPTAIHIEPSKVEFKFDDTYAWTIDKDCFRAESSGCIQMNGLEYTTDPGFDDAGKWTLTGGHSISGGALNTAAVSGSTTNDNSTLAGRDYVVRTVVTSASQVLQIKIGNSTIQTLAATGTKYSRFTTVNTDPLVFSSGNAVYTVTDTDTYLIPSEVSRFGDVEVWGDLTVGMNINLPSGSMTIAGLLIDQPGLPTGSPPNILEIQGSDRGTINGTYDGSSIIIALGDGNNGAGAPVSVGAGGGLSFTAGAGGSNGYASKFAGKGGDFYWETGTGGAHSSSANHGEGGDWTIRLGASGGGTVAHGKYIIEDSTGTDLMVVDKDTGIQHYTGSTSPVETLTGTSNTLTALQSYLCLDGTSGACTATLPSAPVDGRTYHFKCTNATFTCTIARNGKQIDGVSSDLTLILDECVTLVYCGATLQWRIF